MFFCHHNSLIVSCLCELFVLWYGLKNLFLKRKLKSIIAIFAIRSQLKKIG